MHCWLAFLHSLALADGPVVEQVKCRVKLQHRSTVSLRDNDDAGHSPAQTPVAAQAASEGSKGRARPAPSPGSIQQMAGGDDTPRSEGAKGRTADEAMAESAPRYRLRAPNASGQRV